MPHLPVTASLLSSVSSPACDAERAMDPAAPPAPTPVLSLCLVLFGSSALRAVLQGLRQWRPVPPWGLSLSRYSLSSGWERQLSMCSWVSFGVLWVPLPSNLSISAILSNLWVQSCLLYFLILLMSLGIKWSALFWVICSCFLWLAWQSYFSFIDFFFPAKN